MTATRFPCLAGSRRRICPLPRCQALQCHTLPDSRCSSFIVIQTLHWFRVGNGPLDGVRSAAEEFDPGVPFARSKKSCFLLPAAGAHSKPVVRFLWRAGTWGLKARMQKNFFSELGLSPSCSKRSPKWDSRRLSPIQSEAIPIILGARTSWDSPRRARERPPHSLFPRSNAWTPIFTRLRCWFCADTRARRSSRRGSGENSPPLNAVCVNCRFTAAKPTTGSFAA